MNSPKTIVFFDLHRGRNKLGRVKMELWNDHLPQTCQNFRKLCTGEYIKNNKPTGFKETIFYEIKDDYLRGGDFNNNDGTAGESSYGQNFKESPANLDFLEQGSSWILSMVKQKDDRYSSLFQISAAWSKDKGKTLLPFGQILEENSVKVIKAAIESSVSETKHRLPTIVVQCGEM